MATAFLASAVAVVYMNSSLAGVNPLSSARLTRDLDKIQVRKARGENPKKPKVERILLEKAVKNGARCLDGSPPAYYLRKGINYY